MAAVQPAVDEGRMPAQVDRRLGDIAPRVVLDLPREFLALRPGRGRSDQHAVSAGGIDGLDDQRLEVSEDMLAVGGDERPEGLDVFQDRLFPRK